MSASRLLVGAVALALSAVAAAQTPNTLIIVADDIGVDMINCYGEGPDPAVTPHIDRLAAEGVLFRNADSRADPDGPLQLPHGHRDDRGDLGVVAAAG